MRTFRPIKRKKSEEALYIDLKWKIDYENKRNENTNKFINYCLNPTSLWKDNIKVKDRYNRIKEYLSNTDNEVITEFIKNMNYYEFLKTPYWKAVTGIKLLMSNYRCSLCNNSGELHCHHSTYEIRGNEIHSLEKLTVLCKDCHNHFHNKYKTNNGK